MEKLFTFYKNHLKTDYDENITYEKILPTFSHIDIRKNNLIPLSTIYFLFSNNKFKLRRLMDTYYSYRRNFTIVDDLEGKEDFTYTDVKFNDILTYEYIKENGLSIYEYFPGDIVMYENNQVINLYRENVQLVCIVAKIEDNIIYIKPMRYDMDPIAVQLTVNRQLKLFDLIFIQLNDIFYGSENNFTCTYIKYLGNCSSIDEYDRAISHNSNILSTDRNTEVDISAYVQPYFQGNSRIYRANEAAPRITDFVDLTNILTLSIDPETTTDIDDAFSLEIVRRDGNFLQYKSHVLNYEENRRKYNFLLDRINIHNSIIDFNNIARFYKIGIHIADSSRFLSTKCIDSLNLGNTFYFKNFKVEMIEKEISGDLASLVPGVDRFAISLILSVVFQNNELLITDVEICRSKINCDLKLSYDSAEDIFNEKFKCKKCEEPCDINSEYKTDWCFKCVNSNSPYRLDELREHFHIVNRFSNYLTTLKKSTYREIGKESKVFDSHLIIENMMILANMCVTIIIHSRYKENTLIRYHERNLSKEREFLNGSGEYYKLGPINTISESYSAIEHFDVDIIVGIRKAIILNVMNLAKYGQFKDINKNHTAILEVADSLADIFETEQFTVREDEQIFLHYGSGVDFYCHFTSPIRRYFDFLIHQQLISIIEGSEIELFFDVELTLKHLNNMKTKQRQAGLMSNKHITYEGEKNRQIQYSAFVSSENSVFIADIDTIGYVEHSRSIYSMVTVEIICDDYAFYVENKVPVKILN